MTLAFKSRLLLLMVFEVDVLKVLDRFALYSTIGRLKTSNTTRINKIEQQTEDYQQYDIMTRYVLSL
jgi:hypothetical protein